MERKVKTVMRILICAVMMSFFFGCTYFVNETSTEQTEKVTEEQTADEQTIATTEANTTGTNSASSSDFENQEMIFILNTNSKKIHLPDCRSVGDMAEHNKEECVSTLSELKGRSYTPCGRCLAQYR